MLRNLLTTWPMLVSMTLAGQQALPPQSMGTVATHDALVTGGLEVQGERARLLTNASITAYDHAAPIELARGGQVLVCSTSQFHLLHSGTEQSLLFGLDRGAVEIHGKAQLQDVILTPDLRLTFATGGELDLRLRVTTNGDTCVENAGASAPELAISDVFSDAAYHLQPGQHVLFEHGSLHEVVDRERSACGCPAPLSAVQVAQAGGNMTAAQLAESRNPFPAAASQGLAPEVKPANSMAVGETHTQVSSTLAYGGNAEGKDSRTVPPPQPGSVASVGPATPPPAPPGVHDLAHLIGRFFHRLFRSKS